MGSDEKQPAPTPPPPSGPTPGPGHHKGGKERSDGSTTQRPPQP